MTNEMFEFPLIACRFQTSCSFYSTGCGYLSVGKLCGRWEEHL